MADSFIQLPPDSTGKKTDTRTESTNSEHREVDVIGDPTNNDGVASVLNSVPGSTEYGVTTRVVGIGAAAALADDESASTAMPSFGARLMGYDSVNNVWDRSLAYNLIDGDTGAGTYLIPGVNLLQRGSGGPVETGVSTNPLYADPTTNQTITEGYNPAYANSGAKQITYNMPLIYNDTGSANTWNRWTCAANIAGGFAFPAVSTPRVAMVAQYDDVSPDTVTENYLHYPRITQYRALHNNLRDASGNEIAFASDVTVLTSGARTTTQTSADLLNYSGAGTLNVVLDMTTVGTGSVTISIDGKDVASGKYYNLLTGAAVTTNSTNRYRIGSSIAAVANSIALDYLPRTFRIVVTANNANSATYSVGYSLTQ
jgi:hypothetical protein